MDQSTQHRPTQNKGKIVTSFPSAKALFLGTAMFILNPMVLVAQNPSGLAPLMTVPGKVVLRSDFSKPMPLEKSTWLLRQGTRWSIEDGVLRGRESSAEYQAAREHHYGYEPRLSVPVTPSEFATAFSFRFINGSETAIVPFVEFGHHVCRIRLSEQGTSLIVEKETIKLAEAKDFVVKTGKWYHVFAEMKGDEFVIQFADGPTLYAKHASFSKSPTSGGNGLGLAGPKHGLVELDNLTIWSVGSTSPNDWQNTRKSFPKFQPVQIKEPKVKK